MVFYQLVTLLLAVAFAYLLFSKMQSRNTIALHRRPDDIRRKPFESADYTALGISGAMTMTWPTTHSPWDDIF
jgi:hypothetical protein